MSNLVVHGGTPLTGRIVPSANKNAVLPILCATLLTRQPVRLRGVPEITDVKKILEIFRTLGSSVEVDFASGVLDVHHSDTRFDERSHRLPEEMRSSIMLVPPLLARFGVARIENDVQGCTLGVREIDPHVEVLQRFGGEVQRTPDALIVRSRGPLHATQHWLDYASVTTTEPTWRSRFTYPRLVRSLFETCTRGVFWKLTPPRRSSAIGYGRPMFVVW